MKDVAQVSVCIIVKNEPLLEKCILSFKEYISELVIIDTGSSDETTQEIARKYADIFEVYTNCNDHETGLIADFSKARNYSFSKATQKWIFWIDADDVMVGAEKLPALITQFEAQLGNFDGLSVIFPYEYSYDEFGACTCHHYRERLFLNKQHFEWRNPVHEVVCPKDGSNVIHITSEEIVYKHQRQYSNKVPEQGRNLRILQKYVEKIGDTDARQFYYIGLEYCNVGAIDEAIKYLTRYVELSGWADEQLMACLKLVDIYQAMGQYEEALKWALKTITFKENWGESHFAIARQYYFLANRGGVDEMRNWERCAFFAKLGLAQPPTKTLLFVNPLDREYEIHRYLNMALNKLGDIQGALDSTNTGLQKRPNDDALLLNKKIYETWMAKNQLIGPFNKLKELGELDQGTTDLIMGMINKSIPPTAISFSSDKPKEIIVPNYTGLDIVFFLGDGVECWNPDTVKKTGIGGSELICLELSKRLASKGNRVRIYCSCGSDGENIYDGVEYYQTNKFQNIKCDVFIASRRADVLDEKYNIEAKLKLIWVHDLYIGEAKNKWILKADRILALSGFHKQNLINAHNINPKQIIITRNGIDLKRFDKKIKRNQFKCINSSSPDRAWPILLEAWKDIKQQVPEATLSLAYGFKNWEFSAQNDQLQKDLIQRLKNQISDMKSLDVVFLDRINQEQLAEEMLSANALIHPCWFSETSGISFMEAQAAGLKVISTGVGALPETVGDRGHLIYDKEWTSPEYKKEFVDNVVKYLKNDYDRDYLQQYAKDYFCLDKLATEWQDMFYNLIEEVKINPIVPYYPTVQYRHNIVPAKKIAMSVIVPTNRVGGLDILFESLEKQTFKDFELVLVDAIYKNRKNIVEEKSKQYSFKIKHIEPLDNTFPISNYNKSINSALCVAEGELVYLTCDYASLNNDTLMTHYEFHNNNKQINYSLMLPVHYCEFDRLNISNNFPMDNQYGTRGDDLKYQLCVASEEDYTTAHNKWSDAYANDINDGLFNDVLWSIFEKPIEKDRIIENIVSSVKLDTKLNGAGTDLPSPIFHDLCCLKNDSFKLKFLLEANGMDEAMDGSHGYQDTELARRLLKLYDCRFFALNKAPAYITNTRYYLEPRKIINGYNNIEIINKKYISQEPLTNNTISRFKEAQI